MAAPAAAKKDLMKDECLVHAAICTYSSCSLSEPLIGGRGSGEQCAQPISCPATFPFLPPLSASPRPGKQPLRSHGQAELRARVLGRRLCIKGKWCCNGVTTLTLSPTRTFDSRRSLLPPWLRIYSAMWLYRLT